MNVLNLLGYGTALGLGTPQQQRNNVFREQELAQRKALADQELARRREEDAIQGKRWDMQYGAASPEELSMVRPLFEESGTTLPQAGISRPMLQHLLQSLNTLAMREPNMIVDPTDLSIQGETTGRKAPMLPSVQGQYEAQNPDVAAGENPEPSGFQTRAPKEARQGLVLRPGSFAQMLARRTADETEARRATESSTKATKEATRLANIQKAREMYERGVDIKAILPQFPDIALKDIYGEERKETPEKTPPAKNLEQRYLEILDKDPAQWTPAEKQIVADWRSKNPDRASIEADRNADRDAARNDRTVNQIDTRYNGYLAQFGPMGAFSQPPVRGARPVQPMTKGEYIALTEPKERYKTYFGKDAPDLKKVKGRRTLAIAQSMFPDVNLPQLKQAALGGDKAAEQKLETILNQAATVLKREIAELPEE